MIFSPDGRQRVLFIEVPEGKEIKNRIHFDLRPLDLSREDEIERVLALGAKVYADHRQPDGRGWMTLTDPEGNEFCILRGELELPDPYAHLVT
jgi:predicted enzyme related to lactoylglutathione lyase